MCSVGHLSCPVVCRLFTRSIAAGVATGDASEPMEGILLLAMPSTARPTTPLSPSLSFPLSHPLILSLPFTHLPSPSLPLFPSNFFSLPLFLTPASPPAAAEMPTSPHTDTQSHQHQSEQQQQQQQEEEEEEAGGEGGEEVRCPCGCNEVSKLKLDV